MSQLPFVKLWGQGTPRENCDGRNPQLKKESHKLVSLSKQIVRISPFFPVTSIANSLYT